MKANINEIRGITDSIRKDTRDLAGKITMAIAIEEEFIDAAKAVLSRFASVDKADVTCRKAVYELTGSTENWFELQLMLSEHEKKLRKLRELMSFVGGWEVNFK